jgi:signal peptidase I, archaeal type
MLFVNISTIRAIDIIRRGGSVTGGYYCAIINSGSMEPSVSVSDLLLIKGGGEYEPNDIVTFMSKRGFLVTHRVTEVTDNGYITQGDSNNIPDEETESGRILGRVVFIIPGFGKMMGILLSPVTIAFLGCIWLMVWLIQKIKGDQNEDEDK